MNTSQYKNSMDELSPRKYSYDELLTRHDRQLKTANRKISSFAFALVVLLFANILWQEVSSGHNISITVTAYAAEKEIALSRDFVDIKLDAQPVDGGSSDYDCYVNYNINFKCEGEDIEAITYTCNDQEVTRSNRANASAYYVENKIVTLEEYGNKTLDKSFLYGYYAPGESTAKVTTLIGSSYQVSYEDQNDIQYGLILSATYDGAFHYSIEDTIIRLDIRFKDGSVEHRKIIIKSSEDAFSEIQLRIQ